MTDTSTAQLQIPPTPRPITRRASWRAWAEAPVQLWWKSALLVTVVIVWVTVTQVRGYLREKYLLERGLPVKARIVELSDRKLGTGGYKPLREVELYVKLEGVLPDGREFHYEGMLPKAEGYAELGGELPLRVDPNDLSRWVEVREAPALWHPFMAAFLLLPLVLVLLGIAQWRRLGVLKVWREGKLRDGYVMDCKHSAMAPRSRICRFTIPEPFDRRVFRMLYPSRHGVPREGEVLQMIVLSDQPGHPIVADLYLEQEEDGAQMSITAHIFGVNRQGPRSTALGRLWQQLAIATNWPVLVSIAVLCALGVCSIWADRAAPADGKKQLFFIAVGSACLVAFQAVNYQKIGRWAWGFYIIALLLILYTIVPFTHVDSASHAFLRVPKRNGAYGWINFGPMALQPAELMKIGFVMVMARYLRFRSNYRTLKGLLAPFALALIPLALIMKQPDLGTALTFIPTLFVMLFVAGAKLKHLLAIMGLGLIVAPILWLAGPIEDGGPGVPVLKHLPVMVKKYQRERVQAMFANDPRTDRDKGYQQKLAMTAFGSGGITGKGIGQIPVGEHVPERHNDMVFALIGEQFGLFGAAVVLGAYGILFAAGIEIASNTREPFGRLVAVGVVAMLAGQTFLNLMVCLKLMPVTGLTLPFVSYGGSSLVASFIAAGLLLNIGQNRPFVVARDAFEYDR